jgi:SAM-dependent methyltransferase
MAEDWALHRDRRRAGSFGDDAERYDRVRPQYPAALIAFLLAPRPQTVLDVGCGTGIAARLFMAQGCDVLGIEPDSRMAAVARRQGVTVEEGTIEEWSPGDRRFDLLTAGQAWHWVDPHRGPARAAAALRPGGHIGLFWNQAQPDPSVRPSLDEAYARHAPELGRQSVLMGQRDVSLYESIAESFRRTGEFDDGRVW